jgi:hypothetical protein
LYEARFAGTNLDGATLLDATIQEGFFHQVSCRGCNINSANFQGAWLQVFDGTGTTGVGAKFDEAHAAGIVMVNGNLMGSSWQDVIATGGYFEGANLGAADLRGAYIPNADFEGVNLNLAVIGDGTFLGGTTGLPRKVATLTQEPMVIGMNKDK